MTITGEGDVADKGEREALGKAFVRVGGLGIEIKAFVGNERWIFQIVRQKRLLY